MKKIVKRILLVLLVVILLFGGYAAYVFGTYYRLPDKLTLEVKRNGANSYFDEDFSLVPGEAYFIMTYNIGFGAYRKDYSFFMDGGKSSWGKDVDLDGTRSYHVDQLALLNQFMKGYYYDFAQDYDSPFLFFPPWEPHGANKSALVTYSREEISDAMRRSLPISESVSKLVDLDRCYSISRIPTENGRYLCLYNVHTSAYGGSDDYKKGNYVICGGDFNHNLREGQQENAPEWAYPFPRESLPEGFHMGIDSAKDEEDVVHNTCRSAETPYDEDTTYTVTLDGFIVSNNVDVNYYQHMDWGYELSDHDPVLMQFILE